MPKTKRPVHAGAHRYQKVKWGKNQTIIWRCTLPGCNHYLHNEMIEGKLSRCIKCDSVFVMNKDKMLRKRPKCNECQESRQLDPALQKLDDLLEDL
jgi:ssDNA-binding Zn-finger/Zn-ribbon topoisomerase 1